MTADTLIPLALLDPSRPLREVVEDHRASLLERLLGGEDGISLGRANARFLDACLRVRFEAARRAAELPAQGVALAAAGSLGRRAVALRSDADVVVVVGPGALAAREAGAFAEALLYPMWDATLAVGHQVLGADDAVALAQRDLATATTLLDLRFLAGDPQVVSHLVARAHEGLFGEPDLRAFFGRIEEEAAARHDRFGGSVYLLEPDVKSGAGGLRDLDGMRWAARARYRVGERACAVDEVEGNPGAGGGEGGGDQRQSEVWAELVRLGVLVAREAQENRSAEELLWRLRNRLHARASRKADRLGFEEQEVLAVAMGYGEDRARAAEHLMQDYYLHARAVTRAREALFRRLLPPRRRGKVAQADLGGGVHSFDGQVTLAANAELLRDPALAMRACAASVRCGEPLLPFTRDALASHAADGAWADALRSNREAADLFVELVCTVSEAPARGGGDGASGPASRSGRGSVLAELHDIGLLLAMVPEFLPVTGQVHHDVYHVYTVDVHSVAAVDRLRQLARGELAPEYPLATRLAAEIARPRPLFLATLLHDVGKGWPDADGSRRNHSRTGAELCARILPRLGLTAEETEEARQLVLSHLLMYHVATRRDLDDPSTIEEFCRNVRGREGLRNLYLLTVADLSTTSPTAMTSWKARMLEELYFAAEAHLAGTEPPADAERSARVREAVRQAWGEGDAGTETRLSLEQADDYVASMPERYLVANDPGSIVAHARVAAARGARAAHVARVRSPHAEAAQLCVVAEDRPGLLAGIAAALTSNRLEVLAAQVYSRHLPERAPMTPVTSAARPPQGPVCLPSEQGGGRVEAVDLFWVRDREGGTEGVERALLRLARDLEGVCAGRVDPEELLRSRVGANSPWRERPSPAVPTEVLIDERASPRHTVVEVFAKDRPGLLYRLARALHDLGLSIALSKINTEGTRVADVFYVSELDGSKLAVDRRHREVHDALVRAVEG